jgi:hypothetical protein
MEILSKSKTALFEIYSKYEKPSTDEEPNENSHIINIVEIVVTEYPEVEYIEFDRFIEIIDDVYSKSFDIYKNFVLENNSQEIFDEFEEIVNSRKFYLLSDYLKKNNIQLTQELVQFQILEKIISITFVKDYIKNYIPDTSNMMIVRVKITQKSL